MSLPKKLSREKVLDSWSVLVENGMGRGKQVYEEHAKKIILISLVIIVILILIISAFFHFHFRTMRPTSNSWIMDKPTIEDEKPREGYGNTQWWAWYGYAYSDDNDEILLNGNIYPRDGTLYGHSYTLNGVMDTFNFKLNPPDIKWDETTNTLSGTFTRERDGIAGTWTLKFPEAGYRVFEHRIQDEIFTLQMWERGVPLWGAKTEDQMLRVGWAKGNLVCGGGFHDNVIIKVTLKRGDGTKIFNGFGMYARAWLTEQIGKGEAVVGFINEQPEFYINFMYIRNPYNLNEVFVKQGRIGFPDKAYRFDDFTYSGDKWPELKWFKLTGKYEDGEVNLSGVNIGFLHYRQHHPLVKWTGTITRNGKTINVNSLGSGEFRQMQP